MSIKLNENLTALLNDPNSLKVLASVDQNGVPHVVFKGSISVNQDGKLQYLELIETSQTNKNLAYSLWFKRWIVINVLGQDRTSWQIKGTPVRSIISGPVFEENYAAIQKRFGEGADLSTVWIIDPEEAREETFPVRLQEERKSYPLIGHLDRF
ncbi:MAG TPA: hypothetical protein VN381_06535 [Anaerovoracaceae bacterium]|nr:hypothetical protein [Anaerovoracaceae bacterium]